MNENLIPIIISCISLLISGLALGWNIYRDLILKARLKIRFSVCVLVQKGQKDRPKCGFLSATNMGPGEVICNQICFKYRPLFCFSKKVYTQGIITPDYENPINGKIPKKLQVGETLQHAFRYTKELFLKDKITHIGFVDSFGREHYAPRKNVKDAKKIFIKDFNISPDT